MPALRCVRWQVDRPQGTGDVGRQWCTRRPGSVVTLDPARCLGLLHRAALGALMGAAPVDGPAAISAVDAASRRLRLDVEALAASLDPEDDETATGEWEST